MHGSVQAGLPTDVPLISIVIPAFNAVEYLEACLNSVLREVDAARALAKAEFEIIIVDDCSSDGTGGLARALLGRRKDSRFATHDTNRGPAAARNTGIDASRGDYILFLDSDNTLLEGALPRIVDAVHEHAEADVTILGMDLIDAHGARMGAFYGDRVPANPLERLRSQPLLLLDSNIMDTFCIIRTSAARLARYDEALSQLSDWDFWVRLRYEHQCSFAMLQEPVAGYRLHPGQMSQLHTPTTRRFARETLQIQAKALAMAARLDLPLPAVRSLLSGLQNAGSAYIELSTEGTPPARLTERQAGQGTAPAPGDLATIQVSFGARAVPFTLRGDSVADQEMVTRIFRTNEYDISQWEQGRRFLNYYAASVGSKPGLIIDAGASIGASAVYFLESYRNSFVCAIEPEIGSFRILELNTRPYKNKTNLQAVVADSDGELYPAHAGSSEWSASRSATALPGSAAARIHAVSVPSILKAAAAGLPMIFKCDLEGGEDRLFSGDPAWMRLFPVVIVELHDRILPFSGTSRNFIRAVARHDFDFIHRGDKIFLFNRELLS